jgi:hypothetical protein
MAPFLGDAIGASARTLMSPAMAVLTALLLVVAGAVALNATRRPAVTVRVFGISLIALAGVSVVAGFAAIPRPWLQRERPQRHPDVATRAHAATFVRPRVLALVALEQAPPASSGALGTDAADERARILDGWYRPYRITVRDGRVCIASAGADGVFDTPDDLCDTCTLTAQERTRLRALQLVNDVAHELGYEHGLPLDLAVLARKRHWPKAETTDGWGHPFRLAHTNLRTGPYYRPLYEIISAGPDGAVGTKDDLRWTVN